MIWRFLGSQGVYFIRRRRGFWGPTAPKNRGVGVSNTLFLLDLGSKWWRQRLFITPLNFRKYRSCDFLSSFVALSVEDTPSATHATSTMTTLLLEWRKSRGEKFCLIFQCLCLLCQHESAMNALRVKFPFRRNNYTQKKASPQIVFSLPPLTFCFFIQPSRSVFKLTTPLSRVSIVFELRKMTLL